MSTIFKVCQNFENSLDLHFLPAKVDGNGTTNPNIYFNSYTREEKDGILTNAIRGFPLIGEIHEVPTTHKAIVLQESKEPLTKSYSRNLYVTGNFEKFHYWNYDKIPSKADTYKQALQFLDISEELSSPVSILQIENEMKEHVNKSGSKENSFQQLQC